MGSAKGTRVCKKEAGEGKTGVRSEGRGAKGMRAKPTHQVGHLELHGLVFHDELQLVATHTHADPCWQPCIAGACVSDFKLRPSAH